MKNRSEGTDLLGETIDELLRAYHRQCRDVVDGFLGIKIGALAADPGESVYHVGPNAQQSELEDLKQPARTRADDQYVHHGGHGQSPGR